MRIALINENSQASKNKIIYDALVKTNKDNEIINYSDENTNLTYVQVCLDKLKRISSNMQKMEK